MKEIDWVQIFKNLDPSSQFELLCEKTSNVLAAYVPTRKPYQKNDKVNIPRDRKILMRKRKKCKKKLKNTLNSDKIQKLNAELVNLELLLQESHKKEKEKMEKTAIEGIEAIKKN